MPAVRAARQAGPFAKFEDAGLAGEPELSILVRLTAFPIYYDN